MDQRSDTTAVSGTPPSRLARHLVAALLLLVALGTADLALGPAGTGVGLGSAIGVVTSRTPVLRNFVRPAPSPEAEVIVWEVRLPRLITAALVGSLLAMAGVALQGLLMNPLADPYTIGASAGAAVGAAAADVLGIALIGAGLAGVLAAFVAALGASALVYALARVDGRVSVQTVLLAGVVVGTLLWSLIPLLMVLAGRADDMQRIFFYLIGSLQGADWSRCALLTPFAAVTALWLAMSARDLDLMTLGEESAHHLGVAVEPFKRRVLAIGSLATAAAVAASGIIGFVGLVVPHMARRMVGPDHTRLLPISALLGAALLMAADTVVRVWLNDMPVGVVTAVIGAPVFCVLLRRRRAAAW